MCNRGLAAKILQLFLGSSTAFFLACSAEASQPTLTRSEIVGTWSNGEGGTIEFDPGQRFVAKHMDMSGNLQGCGDVSGSGSWEFP